MMHKKLNCVLLVDDNEAVNYLHSRFIKASGITDAIVALESAEQALNYLCTDKQAHTFPELMFLDINMPAMDGWNFIEQYKEKLGESTSKPKIFMLTTSINPNDRLRAQAYKEIDGFHTKPMTGEMLQSIMDDHFES